jgi:ABC-type Fe3+/spermidine/putrescine transport system ATPase subunit
MTYLQIQAITKSFTSAAPAVDRVTFDVAEGDIVCLLGPSGCGKTTLLRLIAGLETPGAGDVRLAGRSILTVPPHERDFGMMFQDFALFPHKNVFDNVAFGLQMRGDSKAQIRARVAEILELVNLTGFERRETGQLSGGEQQRVALARSLAPGPRLLMLDEPLGALDRALRERLMLDVRAILKQVGVTAIYVTHDQTEAFAIADRVAVMNEGRIEQLDSPQTVYHRPATPFVARFLGFHNLLAGTVLPSGAARTPIGDLPLALPAGRAGESVTVLIKPDAATLIAVSSQQSAVSQQPIAHSRQPIAIKGIISAISFRGRYYQVWLEASGERLMFELASPGEWQAGDEVVARLDIKAISVF